MKLLYQMVKLYHIPIMIVLVSKIILFLSVSTLAYYLIPNSRTGLDLWRVWDVRNYLSLASSGYRNFGIEANFTVLLPMLPLLIFLFHLIFRIGFLISGFMVSFVATILLSIMFYKLILLDYPKKIAIYTVLILFLFPTSFFLHIPYSESTFLLLVVAALYFVRTRHYWTSFILTGLATFTKIAGLALIPAIFIEIIFFDRQFFNRKNIYHKLTFLLCGILFSMSGFLGYLFLNFFMWGDFFHFTIIQKQNYHETFTPLGQGLIGAIQSLSWRVGLERIMLSYGQIIAFIIGLVVSIFALLRIRLSYGVYSILALAISYSMSFWVSMPRYILPIFPIYITLALALKFRMFKYLWLLVSISLLVYLSFIFIQYGPVL